jgi:hypothetical protein
VITLKVSLLKGGILGFIGTIILGILAVMRIGTSIFIVYLIGFGLGLIGVTITIVKNYKNNKNNS